MSLTARYIEHTLNNEEIGTKVVLVLYCFFNESMAQNIKSFKFVLW